MVGLDHRSLTEVLRGFSFMPLVNAEPNQDVRFHPAPRAAINLGRMPELTNLMSS
jgi:hypothetical protein